MSDLDQSLFDQLLNTFRAESAEHLETINQSLLQLERAPEPPEQKKLVQDAFRAAHSLKGAARAVNLEEVEALAHEMESVLQQARDQGMSLDADVCDVLYEAVDAIGGLVSGQTVAVSPPLYERLKKASGSDQTNGGAATAPEPSEPRNAPSAPDAPAAPVAASEDTIRVSVTKLDDLMAQVGELLVSKINAEQRQTDINQLGYKVEQWETTWRELKALLPHIEGDTGRKIADVIHRHADYMQELGQGFSAYRQDINRDTVRLGMVTSDLQDRVRHVRMVPFQSLVLGLERAVRDAARSDNKHVSFMVKGGDVELDKKILETLKDPLLHLLRNSVGHGVETPEDRKKAGKLPEGNIVLSVNQRGSEVRILVDDDGRGFDIGKLRRAGMNRGVILGENEADEDIISLAFVPGVSTADEVTTISGRGVGLDVVRQALEGIQGRISVNNRPGKGATIEMIVPTSLAMSRGLMVRIGNERYVLPLLAIESITSPDDIMVVGGKTVLKLNGTPLPLVSLASILERPGLGVEHEANPFAVVMAVADQRLALLVDEVLTEQEIAIKAMAKPLSRVRNVAGAALLGNGEPIVVLNPADLIKSAGKSQGSGVVVRQSNEENGQHHVHILVVDDSITTRTLEKNILEVAGYQVTTATHGEEALVRLKENKIDLIISDIQMPHMDGFELTQHLRGHNEFNTLPIILVTSLESREDRERGMKAGADAYIVKRGFDQAELLATIQKFL